MSNRPTKRVTVAMSSETVINKSVYGLMPCENTAMEFVIRA